MLKDKNIKKKKKITQSKEKKIRRWNLKTKGLFGIGIKPDLAGIGIKL
jgi:hypothetical protein